MMFFAHTFFNAKYPIGRAVMNIQYLLLLYIFIITSTYYSKQIWFYLPISILFFASSLQIAEMYLDMLQPNIKEIIIKTGDKPLYVLGDNPNVRLTNQLNSLNKGNIIQVSGGFAKLNSLLKNDTSNILYLLGSSNSIDSLTFNTEKVFNCRDRLVLYKIIHLRFSR
jgi:hypothetical protein